MSKVDVEGGGGGGGGGVVSGVSNTSSEEKLFQTFKEINTEFDQIETFVE
jgi:hypothetical protein